MPAAPSPFTPAVFDFFRELAEHNDKEWFESNRARYEEDVLEPSRAFVLAFRPHLREISPRFQAEPRVQGGSLFRIHTNRRFNPDRPPYKTHAGIQFRHGAASDVHAPGFYLHLEPGACFAGMGLWRPDRDALRSIREAIVEDPDAWTGATREPPLAGALELGGETLKRGPAGFDRDHPLIDDVKRKDFIAHRPLSEDEVTGDGFVESFAATCRAGSPLVAWLCGAVGVPFRG